jgi:hypothetical protein
MPEWPQTQGAIKTLCRCFCPHSFHPIAHECRSVYFRNTRAVIRDLSGICPMLIVPTFADIGGE